MPTVLTGNDILFYLGLGLGAGVLSATFGIGSGIVVVPMLTLFALMSQKEAQGIALAVMVPMSIMGALRYYWHPEIPMNLKIVAIMSVACIVGANIGASIAHSVSNRALQFGFSILLSIVSIRMFFTAWKSSGL